MAKKICICEGIYASIVAILCLLHFTIAIPHIPSIIRGIMVVISSVGVILTIYNLKKGYIDQQQCFLTIIPVISMNLLFSSL